MQNSFQQSSHHPSFTHLSQYLKSQKFSLFWNTIARGIYQDKRTTKPSLLPHIHHHFRPRFRIPLGPVPNACPRSATVACQNSQTPPDKYGQMNSSVSLAVIARSQGSRLSYKVIQDLRELPRKLLICM